MSAHNVKKRIRPTWIVVIAITVCALLFLGVLWAMNIQQERQADPLVVTVNGEAVYASEILTMHQRLPEDMRAQYSPEVILNQTIDKLLVLQYAKEQGVEITQEQLEEGVEERMTFYGTTREELRELLEAQGESMEEFEMGIRDELILDVFVSTILLPSIQVSDSEVQAYYRENMEEFEAPPGHIRVRHLLVATEQEAEDLRRETMQGVDFSALASAYSLDSAPRGGDLGFISEESPLVEPFKQAALELEVGEVSSPVETQFGWHLIKREEDVIPLRDARFIIEERLREQRAQQRFQTLLVELREQGTIKYHRGADVIREN